MTSLKELQKLFKSSVMLQTGDLVSEISEGGRIGPEQRLAIYGHAYGARLREVLQKDFPVLHTMLGDEQFYSLCNAYIAAYPSEHPSLRYLGRHMETFLEGEKFREQPFLAEMARFEWTFIDVFDASDRVPVTFEQVATLSPGSWTTLRFVFHPSLHWNSFAWNVPAIWSSVQRMEVDSDEEPVSPQKNADPIRVIQWRHDLVSYFRSLENDEAQMLDQAMTGTDFAALCECLAGYHGEEAPMRAAEFLKTWVTEGLITGLDFADFT
ncbi:DNA-binding domain-containing protein [Emcibacter sp.]|uniref:HvfC/BufC N-terminal domain-containing protein n=1 Tax=Emcibacter sp. TaxID=1979954 RepID=UPI002AA8D2D8|nr:DNA-binding domain-containing protein [Emcibacter sp.]